MLNTTIKIVNAETGEEIIRNMNDEEFTQHQADQAAYAARLAAKTAKAEAKAALLARLGITAEEAALLLGGN